MPSSEEAATEKGRELLGRNAALTARLSALGARGAAAAAALAGRGTPPPDDFVAALEAAGREFEALRGEALEAAEAAGVVTPSAGEIGSTTALQPVLQALVAALEAAERRAALARVRDQALAVLDRVGGLAHRDDPAFASLLLCQKRANEVRAALAAAVDADPTVQQAAAVEMTAPFTAVLALLDGAAVDDEQWAALEDAVAAAFGRPLAAAAARGRLRQR
jgi:hypothetical protein